MVLGIVACVFLFIPGLSFIGPIVGIVGIILGVIAKKNNPSSMATAGFVLSIIGTAVSLAGAIICVACVGALGTAGAGAGALGSIR